MSEARMNKHLRNGMKGMVKGAEKDKKWWRGANDHIGRQRVEKVSKEKALAKCIMQRWRFK